MVVERTISLGNVAGRIDHLAIDVARKRLFVSELGVNSVAVVDLESGKVIRQIDGLHESAGNPIFAGNTSVARSDDAIGSNILACLSLRVAPSDGTGG